MLKSRYVFSRKRGPGYNKVGIKRSGNCILLFGKKRVTLISYRKIQYR